MKIRPIEADDFKQWLPLWQGYLTFYKSALGDAQTQLTFNRLLDQTVPMHGFVAEEAGKLIGFTVFLYHLSSWGPVSYCYLEDLFTSEEARGKGVAAALIDAVAGHAKAQGATKLYWQTHESNKAARALYSRVAENEGFIVYARKLD
jgi:GNAT superfamily N-acetyltransferase